MRVHKLNHKGELVWHYDGVMLYRDATTIQLEAFFFRDYTTPYHTFRRGDRMVEWFYSDRWYNVFQMHDVDDDRLKGWYCNITRPARLEATALYAEDLALDLMVYPDGQMLLLDEDDFAALDLDETTHQQALQGLADLQHLITARQEMFALLPG